MWRTRKWLHIEHGVDLAEELIVRKKALGDKSWAKHPDFPDAEAWRLSYSSTCNMLPVAVVRCLA
jgi:hypothetical protein